MQTALVAPLPPSVSVVVSKPRRAISAESELAVFNTATDIFFHHARVYVTFITGKTATLDLRDRIASEHLCGVLTFQIRSFRPGQFLTTSAKAAWETGDPELVFIDTINRTNPTPANQRKDREHQSLRRNSAVALRIP